MIFVSLGRRAEASLTRGSFAVSLHFIAETSGGISTSLYIQSSACSSALCRCSVVGNPFASVSKRPKLKKRSASLALGCDSRRAVACN